jgi:hypothetical protein
MRAIMPGAAGGMYPLCTRKRATGKEITWIQCPLLSRNRKFPNVLGELKRELNRSLAMNLIIADACAQFRGLLPTGSIADRFRI